MERKRTPLWPLAPALVAYALLAWRFNWLCDDSYISFRYARHLAEGVGLRFNLDAQPPVEGYSNFLWVLWLGLGKWLGAEPTWFSALSSSVCGALLVTWTTRFAARRFTLSAPAAAICGLFMATLPPMAIWATSGLAAMPTALFAFGFYARLLGDREHPCGPGAGVFALLAALTRADGLLWIALIAFSAAFLWLFGGRPRALFRAGCVACGMLVVGVALHVAWRYSYYGDFVPNTAHVKAGFSTYRLGRGFDYLAAYFLTLPALLIALMSALRGWDRELRDVWLPAVVVVAGTLGYALWVGGDFMPMGRFLVPMLPFVTLLFAHGLRGLQLPRKGAIVGALCITLSLAAAFELDPIPASLRARFHFRADKPSWVSELSFWRGMKERAEEWSIEGRAIALETQPGDSIILGAMGARSYYSDITVYDTYGLVTPEVHRMSTLVQPSTPGHDMRVGPEALLHHEPTYVGSSLAPAGEPDRSLIPAGWRERIEIERVPLSEAEGFPPGIELHLYRLAR